MLAWAPILRILCIVCIICATLEVRLENLVKLKWGDTFSSFCFFFGYFSNTRVIEWRHQGFLILFGFQKLTLTHSPNLTQKLTLTLILNAHRLTNGTICNKVLCKVIIMCYKSRVTSHVLQVTCYKSRVTSQRMVYGTGRFASFLCGLWRHSIDE